MYALLHNMCSTVAADFLGEAGFPWNRALKYKRPDASALVGTSGLQTLEACFADNMLGGEWVQWLPCVFARSWGAAVGVPFSPCLAS